MFGDDTGILTEQPTGGVWSDFVGAASARFNELTSRFTSRPTSTTQSVGGSIFEALYQVGAGRIDAARSKAAEALLQSKTGQRFVGEVERQRIQQWLPLIVLGAVGLLLVGAFAGRR